MPFVNTRAQLVLSAPDAVWPHLLGQSRTATAAKVQRAQILLRHCPRGPVSAIAAVLRTNRPKMERCLSKALQFGVRTDLARTRAAGVDLRPRGSPGGQPGLPETRGAGLCPAVGDNSAVG